MSNGNRITKEYKLNNMFIICRKLYYKDKRRNTLQSTMPTAFRMFLTCFKEMILNCKQVLRILLKKSKRM